VVSGKDDPAQNATISRLGSTQLFRRYLRPNTAQRRSNIEYCGGIRVSMREWDVILVAATLNVVLC
jgi:hypothetical protein